MRTLQQEFLQVSSSVPHRTAETVRYAIRSGLSSSSTQFPSFDRLVFTECASMHLARNGGLCLPEGDMSQIKYLTFIGRALRNPFLNCNHNLSTTFSGLIDLDMSALEFPLVYNDNTMLFEAPHLMEQWMDFKFRSLLCEDRLLASIDSSQIISMKMGFLQTECEMLDRMLAESSCLDNLKSLNIIGINNLEFYQKHMAFREINNMFEEGHTSEQILKLGGQLHFGSPHGYYEFICEHHAMDLEEKEKCSLACLELLKYPKLRATLEHLKLGNFVDIEEEWWRDDEDKIIVDTNDSELSDLGYKYILWAKSLSNCKKLICLDMTTFDSKAVNIIVKHIVDNPPLNLSTIKIMAPPRLKDSLFTSLQNRQKTIDHWFKPRTSIAQKPLTFVYTSFKNPLISENVYKEDIKRWSK